MSPFRCYHPPTYHDQFVFYTKGDSSSSVVTPKAVWNSGNVFFITSRPISVSNGDGSNLMPCFVNLTSLPFSSVTFFQLMIPSSAALMNALMDKLNFPVSNKIS